MCTPCCQPKVRRECVRSYSDGYNRRRHEDPNYVDEDAWAFIHSFSNETEKNYLLARHLRAATGETWKTLRWLLQADVDAALDKRNDKRHPTKGYTTQPSFDKSGLLTVPLTDYFGPEEIEKIIGAKGIDVQDSVSVRMHEAKFGHVAAELEKQQKKYAKVYTDNALRRMTTNMKLKDGRYGWWDRREQRRSTIELVKRNIGTTGFRRLDADLERPAAERRIGQQPTTIGHFTKFQRNAEKNQMKGLIQAINEFYADVAELKPIEVADEQLELTPLAEELLETLARQPAAATSQEAKLRLSNIIHMLKRMPGYETFERVLFHEPFDRDKPWTWMRTFPRKIPQTYLKRISESVLLELKRWQREQKLMRLAAARNRRPAVVRTPRHHKPHVRAKEDKSKFEVFGEWV